MASNLSGKKVTVLGAGKMGGILLQALLKNGLLTPELTTATVAHEERAKAISAKLGIPVLTNNLQAAKDADVILIAVKPQVVEEVAAELRGHISPRQLVISVAASVPNNLIEKTLDSPVPVIRAMPNTPCLLSCGMT
ncbi:MAG: prephenate dehydrogenase/arogenate dehydrogenase family protein, partial [Candidatus Sulfotelmatobacter sp.]